MRLRVKILLQVKSSNCGRFCPAKSTLVWAFGRELGELCPVIRKKFAFLQFIILEILRFLYYYTVMLTKDDIIEILKKNYDYLVTEFGMKRIGLFGSYTKNTFSESSDIDIVVEFDHPVGFRFIEFSEYLESLFNKKVDVLTPAGIKGIRVDRISRSIMESIEYV